MAINPDYYKGRPRPYDLSQQSERDRLMREISGYVLTSKFCHEGTDRSGREFAANSLREALELGFALTPPKGKRQ